MPRADKLRVPALVFQCKSKRNVRTRTHTHASTTQVEDSVEFAEASPKPEKGQLLENVYPDPRGFGIGDNGEYRYLQPGFGSGNAAVS